jgi:hypothetical protein
MMNKYKISWPGVNQNKIIINNQNMNILKLVNNKIKLNKSIKININN